MKNKTTATTATPQQSEAIRKAEALLAPKRHAQPLSATPEGRAKLAGIRSQAAQKAAQTRAPQAQAIAQRAVATKRKAGTLVAAARKAAENRDSHAAAQKAHVTIRARKLAAAAKAGKLTAAEATEAMQGLPGMNLSATQAAAFLAEQGL